MMAMWEYEYFLQALNDQIKEENKQQEDEMKKYDLDSYKKMANPNRMSGNFKMPNLPKMH